MGKFVVIKYEDLEKLKSNTQKLIENTIVDTRKINEARLSEIETIEALSTELSTDESIIDRAEKHYNKPYDVNGIDITPAFNEGYRHGATEQSIIEQMKAKKFAEWCSINEWYYSTASKGWHNPFHIHDFFTTKELFNQFTNQK